jgi:hypothetical protein
MTIVYRTDGAWGTGKGVNLTPVEVDGNFYDLDGRVTYVEDNPTPAVVPIGINIEGALFTMDLSDGSSLGPIVMTMPVPRWVGGWTPSTPYLEMDFFTAPDGGMGAVMLAHTSAATFDWGALHPVSGQPVYQQIVGASGTTSGLADLIDVALGAQIVNDMLVWDAAGGVWRNKTPAAVVDILPPFTGPTGSAPGLKGLVPPPAAGDAVAGKVLGAGGAWIVPAGGSGGSSSLAGLSDVAIVSPVNLSLLQYNSTDGKWHNQTIASLGAGTVTSVGTGAGLTGGPITGVGTIALASVADKALLANVTGSSAAPTGVSLSILLDAVLGTARGSVLWRSASGWVALTAGTAGQFLQTGGTSGDVTWGTPSGAGTVTSVGSGTGLTGGPITSAGTLSLATVTDNQVLANITGTTAPPTGTTFTLLLDHALGATRGMVIYRGASAWAALAPGAAGAVLTAHGAGADPTWVTGSGSGTVTQVNTGTGLIGGPITGTGTIAFATVATGSVLANISGSTAAPSANSLTAIIDAAFGTTRGSVLYRGSGGWAALGPGTAGQLLQTAGGGADPAWASATLPTGTASDQLVYVAPGGWSAQRPRYIASTFVPGVPAASQLLLLQRLSKGITIPANFGDYLGHASMARGTVNATASTTIDVRKATSAAPGTFTSVGTITIAAGSMVGTFATSGGAAASFAQGDSIALVAPATPDATFANFAATLVAYEAADPPPPSSTTWSPTDKTASVTLSGSNLVATATATDQAGRSTRSVTSGSGKYYWEITPTTMSGFLNTHVGVVSGSVALSGFAAGHQGAVLARTGSGNLYSNGTLVSGSAGVIAVGVAAGIALDMVNNRVWIRSSPTDLWNGNFGDNPATMVGGIDISSYIPTAFASYALASSGDALTVNFGTSAFSGTVPSGFTAGF